MPQTARDPLKVHSNATLGATNYSRAFSTYHAQRASLTRESLSLPAAERHQIAAGRLEQVSSFEIHQVFNFYE